MLRVAQALAARATCPKLAVGCVLVDTVNRIIGSGYNGVPHGIVHCTEFPCEGADAPPGSDLCLAVHAEQNALLTCQDPHRIYACYCTHPPCLRCTKELLNTACSRITFLHPAPEDRRARSLWTRAGRRWGALYVFR